MKKIALLGQPNSGKSTVFNALTGSRQHVGNWPGKTVEKCEGKFTYENETYSLIDLPGSYGLSGTSDEEIITTSYIRSNEADLTIVLVDASQLERSMFMMAEFAKMGKPAILILNMMDVAAAQGKTIDDSLLSERLGIPVLPFIAAKGKEYNKLKELIKKEIENPHIPVDGPKEKSTYIDTRSTIIEDSKEKYEWIEKILEGVCKTSDKKYTLSKFDKVLTSKFWGKIVCLLIVLAGFIAAMLIMSPFMAVAKMIPQQVPALLSPWFAPHVFVYIFAYTLLGAAAVMAIYQLLHLRSALPLGLSKNLGGIDDLFYVHYRQIPRHHERLALWMLIGSFLLLQMCWWGINYLPSAQGVSVHTYS